MKLSYATEIGEIVPHATRNRFYVEKSGDGPQVVDALVGSCVGFETMTQARQEARFFRQYVAKHGDISLYSVPWNLSQEPDLDRVRHLNQNMGNEPGDPLS
jgi:hypothetical protein